MARFAINGFGRIGRNILRAAIKRGANLEVALLNDVDKPATLFCIVSGIRSIRLSGNWIKTCGRQADWFRDLSH